jgi:hypothetical protein
MLFSVMLSVVILCVIMLNVVFSCMLSVVILCVILLIVVFLVLC